MNQKFGTLGSMTVVQSGCQGSWVRSERRLHPGRWSWQSEDRMRYRKNVLEPKLLSHSLALNYVEQILQNLPCFGELRQAQPTSIAVQLSHLPRITFLNLPAICLLLSDFREQPRWLTVPSLPQSAKTERYTSQCAPKRHSFCVKNEK